VDSQRIADEPPPALDGVEHIHVDLPDVRVHVATAGHGPPVVLLHGWPQNWWTWRHVIPRLATDHRVICPDLRGHGWSSAPSTGYDKEQLATDLLGVLDALELDRVGLAGHDWGGFASFLACLRAPERFRALLVLNIVHPWQHAVPFHPAAALKAIPGLAYQPLLSTPGLGEWVLRTKPSLVARAVGSDAVHRDAFTREDRELFGRRLQDPARAHASSLVYRTWLTREMGPIFRGRYRDKRLEVRTRLLFGMRDAVIRREWLEGYERYADAMEVVEVPDSGHFIAEERPDLVETHLRELLAEAA
jgi:pimeloyl-ACP methyl ester carboxylesterase